MWACSPEPAAQEGVDALPVQLRRVVVVALASRGRETVDGCGCRKLGRGWSGGMSVLVDESVRPCRFHEAEGLVAQVRRSVRGWRLLVEAAVGPVGVVVVDVVDDEAFDLVLAYLPADIRRRWGIADGGEIGIIDLGDAALVVSGGLTGARSQLRRVQSERYEAAVAGIDDPDLRDQ